MVHDSPSCVDATVRWIMAGLGDVVAVVAAVKLWCERGHALSALSSAK